MASNGELVQAIDRFFDRATDALPIFVPAMPSMIAGALVALVVFLMGAQAVYDDYKTFSKSVDLVKRYRWMVVLGLLLVVCNTLSTFVQTTTYRISNISLNKQHFANVHWLEQYKMAVS